MTPVYLDFESFFSITHTLSKMPPTEYVMHPDTELISVAMAVGDGPVEIAFGEPAIRQLLASVNWSDALAVGHNMSGFDSMILKWRLGITPKMWACTAAMARPRYAKVCGVSLAKLCAHLKIGQKLSLEATNMKGKRLADLTPTERWALEVYNKTDTSLCRDLFKHLAKGFPKKELLQIHMTTEMLVSPQFEVDDKVLKDTLAQVREDKRRSIIELAGMLGEIHTLVEERLKGPFNIEEWARAQLASQPKFCEILKARGVPIPTKISKTTGKEAPALAKTDEEFIALCEHPDPIVAAAANTRLSVKSTLLESRIEAFLRAAAACSGKLPVPLKYCGADTTGRWSGEQYNMQNLPRIPRDKIGNEVYRHANVLRKCLLAPKGFKVVVADLSGIELRVNHFLWKVTSSMNLYQSNPLADLYRQFAADRYGITPGGVDESQRQLAKVAQLGLGFGAGAPTFRKVAKLMSDGKLDLSEQESYDIVNDWRRIYKPICDGWQAFQRSLPSIKAGYETAIDPWGLCVTEKEAVRLPSGRRIHYPDLRQRMEEGRQEWVYGNGSSLARIYAGKGVENLVQALARDVIADVAADFYKDMGLCPTLAVHDELVYIVPQTHAEEALTHLQSLMRSPPKWWPELVTWSEGDIADCYGDAK